MRQLDPIYLDYFIDDLVSTGKIDRRLRAGISWSMKYEIMKRILPLQLTENITNDLRYQTTPTDQGSNP